MKETAVLTKTELVESVAAARHLLRRDAEFAVDAVFDTLVRSLAPGGSEIEVRGFGTSAFTIELLRSNPFAGAPIARRDFFRAEEAALSA